MTNARKNNPKMIIGMEIFFVVVFSLLSAYVEIIALNGGAFLTKPDDFIKRIIIYIAIYGTVLLVSIALDYVDKRWGECQIIQPCRLQLIVFVVLTIFFVVTLVLFYPGVNGWDTEYQLKDWFDGVQVMTKDSWEGFQQTYTISDHMCVFDTVLFGTFTQIGKWIGDINKGVFAYCLFQAMLCAYSFSYMVRYMYEKGSSVFRIGIVLAFLVYAPFIRMYSINMLKDSLNAAVFVLYLTTYVQIAIDSPDRKKIIRLTLFTLLMALTKRTGFLIAVLSNIALCIYYKQARKAIAMKTVIIPFVIITIILGMIIYPLFHVWQDGKQEIMGTFYQQVARIVVLHEETFSEQDKEIIDRVIDYSKIKDGYDYYLTDPIKGTYRIQATTGDSIRFILLWIKLFFKYPIEYIKSMIGTSSGYLALHEKMYIYWKFDDWADLGIINPSSHDGYRVRAAQEYINISETPILRWLLQNFLYTFVIPLVIIIRKYKNRMVWICMCPILISLLTLLLSPLVNTRYTISLVFVSPLVMAYTVICERHLKADKVDTIALRG